jgi:hypothetical protein
MGRDAQAPRHRLQHDSADPVSLDAVRDRYRKGTSFANAVLEIQRCGGTQFDPEVVRAFLDIGEAGLIKIRDDMVLRKRELAEKNAALLTDPAKLKKDGGGNGSSPATPPAGSPMLPPVTPPVGSAALGASGTSTVMLPPELPARVR